MTPRLTVVIPTHNRPRLVREAVRSALGIREVGVDAEVIVVQDGPDDRVPASLERLSADIRLLTQPHSGRSAARNRGIAEAVGPIVGFLDDDDLCVPEGWLALVRALECDRGAAMAFGHARYTTMSGADLPYRTHPEVLSPNRMAASLLMIGGHLSVGAVVVRTDVARRVGGFDEGLDCWEDYDFWLRAAFAGAAVSVTETCACVRDPGWGAVDPTWPTKLAVRARYSLRAPYDGALATQADAAELADFYERLAKDAFRFRMFDISRGAFQRVRALRRARFRRPSILARAAASSMALALRRTARGGSVPTW